MSEVVMDKKRLIEVLWLAFQEGKDPNMNDHFFTLAMDAIEHPELQSALVVDDDSLIDLLTKVQMAYAKRNPRPLPSGTYRSTR